MKDSLNKAALRNSKFGGRYDNFKINRDSNLSILGSHEKGRRFL